MQRASDSSATLDLHPVPGNAPDPDNGEVLFTFGSAMKNIIFGSLAGMVSEIFEYPFDLAKVRLQAQVLATTTGSHQLRFNGPLDCLKQTWQEEGFKGLYRGIEAPLAGNMAQTALIFVAYSGFQDTIRAFTSRTRRDRLSIPELGLAAAGAGFVGSFIITPIELVKCKMQVQMMNILGPQHNGTRSIPTSTTPSRLLSLPKASTNYIHITKHSASPNRALYNNHSLAATVKLPPGAFGVVRETIQSYGTRGLWIGHSATLVRETGGTAAWFVIKEVAASALLLRRSTPSNLQTQERTPSGPFTTENVRAKPELLPWESAVSGAIAGALCVLAFYPADTVKSAMQTEDELRPSSGQASPPRAQGTATRLPFRTFTGTFTRMYAAHGLRGLYAGCGMTVARAIPSSGIVFVVYDSLATWLG